MATRAATSAAQGTGYVPPFAATVVQATRTTAARASTTFAQVGTLPYGGASRTASGAASATTPIRIVDATGGVDSSSLLQYFTIPYIDAHTLSPPTWRYAYILWFVVLGTLVIWSVAHRLAGSGRGGSALGAVFRKFFVRRITITKKKKELDAETGKKVAIGRKGVRFASPTFAQILTIMALIATAVCLSFVGPDYIAPTTCTFGGTCPYVSPSGQKGPPTSNFGRLARRANEELLASLPALVRRQNNPNGWAPFNDPLLASSNTNIDFNAWTAAARLGLISYAMLPLAVTLAVKQWPFNIWAISFLTNYHFDKTAILHRWSGRVIWLFSSGHAAAWFYQLIIDKDPFGRPVLVPALQYWRFLGGLVAYGLLTVMTALSLRPIRTRHYEWFYWSHVIMVVLFCVACIIHHRPLMYWPIVALAWWGAERLSRLCIFVYINGFVSGIGWNPVSSSRASAQSFTLRGAEKVDGYSDGELKPAAERYPYSWDPATEPLSHAYPPATAPSASPAATLGPISNHMRSLPPPGFAAAQLLPGRMVRLTMHTAVPVRWRPGQHVFLTIPAVRMLQSHPYTIVSIDERAKGIAPIGGFASFEQGSEIVLLVRAQRGFSRRLWDHVYKKRQEKLDRGASVEDCASGVLLRSLISLPMGSSIRTMWDAYDSLTIVCGGTGITFGMSVLEYTCKRMARRDSGRYRTARVRFIWILREFAHLSWIASALRQCLDLVDPSQIQVELFVSRADQPGSSYLNTLDASSSSPGEALMPPKPQYARQNHASAQEEYADSDDETAASTRMYNSVPDYGEHIDSVTDLVLFDGEEDERSRGDAEISARVRSLGKLRRALSRRDPKQPAHDAAAYVPGSGDVGYSSMSYPHQTATAQQSFYPAASQQSFSESFQDLSFARAESRSDLHTLTASSSMQHLVGKRDRHRLSSFAQDSRDPFDLTKNEQDDLEIVAALARPGYPKLKEILDDEVSRSTGKTLVACCGPNGLNTIVRHLVSSRIDVGKSLKGDPRGQVSLVCEDFSF
ncbi:hypothetical protein OIV83_000954 [Microbotryomycetes sp. JL201]|nr:hypothetical protein OIV83_000954 [Microbotryomycetes sp. JL201]